MTGNDSAANFDRHNRRDTFEKGDHHGPQHKQVSMLFRRLFTHARGDRTEQSVTEQNAEKSANERSGNFFPNLFGRPSQCSHGDDDTQYGGNDTESGQRVGHAAERRRWLERRV